MQLCSTTYNFVPVTGPTGGPLPPHSKRVELVIYVSSYQRFSLQKTIPRRHVKIYTLPVIRPAYASASAMFTYSIHSVDCTIDNHAPSKEEIARQMPP
jgi:hypothetical protein